MAFYQLIAWYQTKKIMNKGIGGKIEEMKCYLAS